MNRHPHPYWLWDRLKPLRPLLLIPAVRLLYSRLTHTPFTGFLRESEIAAAVFLVGLGSLWTVSYQADDRAVRIRERFPWAHTRCVLLSQVASIDVERTPFMALTGGRRIQLRSSGCSHPLRLYPDRKSTRLFLPPFRPALSGKLITSFIWALSGSDAAFGWLYAIIPLRQTARFLGKHPVDEWNSLKDRLPMGGLPALLTGLAVLLAVGWGISFVRRLAVGLGFSADFQEGEIRTRSGFLTRQYRRLFLSHIHGVQLRQTLGLSLCGLYSAAAIVESDFDEIGHERPVICQTATKRDTYTLLSRLLPGGVPSLEPALRLNRRGKRRYWLPPLLWCLPGCALLLLGPGFRPVGGLWLTGTLWWLIVRLHACRIAGITVTRAALLLRFPQKLALHTVILPARRQESLRIRQSPWQKRVGLGDVIVCVGGGRFRVRALPVEAVKRLWMDN